MSKLKSDHWWKKDDKWDQAITSAPWYFKFTREPRERIARLADVKLSKSDIKSFRDVALNVRSVQAIETAIMFMIDEMANAETEGSLGEVKIQLRKIKRLCLNLDSNARQLAELMGVSGDYQNSGIRELDDFTAKSGWSATVNVKQLIEICDRGLALKKGKRPDIVFYGFLTLVEDAAHYSGISTKLPPNERKNRKRSSNESGQALIEFVRTAITVLAEKTDRASRRLDSELRKSVLERAKAYRGLSDGGLIDRMRVVRVMNEVPHMGAFLADLDRY